MKQIILTLLACLLFNCNSVTGPQDTQTEPKTNNDTQLYTTFKTWPELLNEPHMDLLSYNGLIYSTNIESYYFTVVTLDLETGEIKTHSTSELGLDSCINTVNFVASFDTQCIINLDHDYYDYIKFEININYKRG